MNRRAIISAIQLLRVATLAPVLALTAAAQIPAFPGAEGAGALARGGRGGDVYHVTNTNPSGAGSLAYGLTTGVPSAGRTIVFDVSGYAHISVTLRVTASKITIAGQTAPGDGFGLKDGTFLVSGDDIVIRHLRFRNGNSADSIDLDSGSLNSIFDHCDAMFSNDENMSSFSSPPENLTFQWGLNAWGMESHSCGGLWDQNHATCHHSLWAHNHTRNPKARPSLLDWVNNVTFDWDIGFILADSETPANWNANVIGNYFITGASGKSKALEKGGRDRNGAWNFHVYLNNNRFDGDRDGTVNGVDTGYGMVSGDIEHLAAPLVNAGVPVTIDDPLLAYKKIVSSAGPLRTEIDAAKPLRDEVAALLMTQLVAQTHFHVSSVAGTGLGNGGFGTLASAVAPLDADGDGMPDYYESALGWNPATDDHATALASSGGAITGTTFLPPNSPAGYTRLEEYLHFLTIPHGTVKKSVTGALTSVEIPLSKFTSGFTVNPVFTIANVAGGTVTQSGTGGAVATFKPTLNTTGRARFDFTVTDGQGSSWAQTCALVVSTSGTPRDLIWNAAGAGSNWDTTSTNWLKDEAAAVFSSGDYATFSGPGAPSVSSAGVAASGIVVDSSSDYTFTGSGALIGPLTKRGTGTLTINNTGTNNLLPATLDSGTLALTANTGLGAGGTLTLTGGTLNVGIATGMALNVVGNAALNVSGSQFLSGALTGAGTLSVNVTGSNTLSLQGNTTAFGGTLAFGSSTGFVRLYGSLGSPAATFDLGSGSADLVNRDGNNTFELGALTGGSGTTVNGASSTNAPSTYRIGATGASTTYAGAILNGGAGAAATTSVIKAGSGKLTLTGASTYTGTTTVSTGTLEVNGSLGATATTVAGGATLSGTGSLGGVVTLQDGATMSPGAGTTPGNLRVGAGLVATGTTLAYALTGQPDSVPGTPNVANDRITLTGGTIDLNNGTANTLAVNYVDGALGIGTYTLVTGGAATQGVAANLSYAAPSGTRQNFVLNFPAGKVQIVVSGNPAANLTWVGSLNSATWDLGATGNFTGAAGGTFFNLDAVAMDDTAASKAVTLAGSLAPRSVSVNTASGYSFTGGGALTGSATLLKSGLGTLTISNTGTSTFNGGTTVNGGAIVLGNVTANNSGLGSGPVILNGATLTIFDAGAALPGAGTLPNDLVINNAGTLNMPQRGGFSGRVSGSGVLTYYTPYVRGDVSGDWSGFTGRVNVVSDADGGDFRVTANYFWAGLPDASLDLSDRTNFKFDGILNGGSGTFIEIGELSGTASAKLLGGSTGGRNFTYTIGAKTPGPNSVTFAGAIAEQNSGTATSIIKAGAGTWVLNGNCAYNGSTTVAAGTLRVAGALASGGAGFQVQSGATLDLAGGTVTTADLRVATGGQLTGRGTIVGDFTNSGTVSTSTGTLTITGDVVNNGIMRITNRAALAANGAFVNNGTLDLLTGLDGLPPNLENHGVVIDSRSLHTLTAVKSGSTFTISVQTAAGHNYKLQRSPSLATPTWTDIEPLKAGTGGAVDFVDSAANGSQQFYRVTVTP